MDKRNEYILSLYLNGRQLSRIIIDQHYKEKHDEVTDSLIIELVKTLDMNNLAVESEKDGFQYFTVEPVIHEEKPYRLVLLLCINENFLGVVNAFRIRRK